MEFLLKIQKQNNSKAPSYIIQQLVVNGHKWESEKSVLKTDTTVALVQQNVNFPTKWNIINFTN